MVCVALGCLSLVSCINDDGIADEMGTRATKLSFDLVMPLAGVSAPDGYENGNKYENTIDIVKGDFRVYFYNSEDDTYIAKLEDATVTSTDADLNTTYTIEGEVPEELRNYTTFKVVMLANWGTSAYAEPQTGSTIDDLCDAETAVFNASTYFSSDNTTYIPFYGVHEYDDVTFTNNETTELSGDLTLLRALAKVEVILTNADDGVSFEDVSIVHYNSQGYCAPTGVYSQDDYGQPTTCATDYVDGLHLVNKDSSGDGVNDSENAANATTTRTQAFNKDEDATVDTWTLYLPEYDNSGEDYSYILIKTQYGEEHKVYFAEYVDGKTDAYDEGGTGDRWNIRRNNLYRYYVTVTTEEEVDVIRVVVNDWEYLFDNTYTFGETE